MRSGVNDAVSLISVRQIRAILILIKSKLKNLHTWKSGFLHQFDHTVCKKSKILRDHIQLAEIFLQSPEKLNSRSFFPMAKLCCFISIRNGIILIKPSEMVNTYNVIKLHAVSHAKCPPRITCLFMVIPVIKRISPELSCSRKSIRWASGNTYRQIFFIKLKKLRLRPGICTVKSNIDRHIPDDLHTFIVGISLQLCPLLKEPELLETIKCHFPGKFFPSFIKCCLISVL